MTESDDKHLLIPVSAVIATANRKKVLEETLISLAEQNRYPMEVLIIDGSDNADTETLCYRIKEDCPFSINYYRAPVKGAALQRNYGVDFAQSNYILFFDDDIIFYPDCIEKLWLGIQNESVGGVNALIDNQHYQKPGIYSQWLYRILNGRKEVSYAGKCIGPAFTLLPEPKNSTEEFVEVEWLNSTCTLYKKEALPNPVFSTHFTGYSYMEDVALSLIVGKKWRLINAQKAKIFHNSQSGDEKSNVKTISEMELVNRYYIMKHILGQKPTFANVSRLLIQQFSGALTSRQIFMSKFWQGKLSGFRKISKI